MVLKAGHSCGARKTLANISCTEVRGAEPLLGNQPFWSPRGAPGTGRGLHSPSRDDHWAGGRKSGYCLGKDAWLHLPVKVMLYLASGWAVHMGSAPSGWPAALPSEARRRAQRTATQGKARRGAPITYEKGARAAPPVPGVGPPGRQAPPSEFPLWLGPGQTPRLESQAESGYSSPGCWQVTPGPGLSPVPRLWRCRPREPQGREGRRPGLSGGASLGGGGTAGFWGAAPGNPGGREDVHTHPAGGGTAGAELQTAEVPARAHGSNLCHRRPPASQRGPRPCTAADGTRGESRTSVLAWPPAGSDAEQMLLQH